MLRCFCSAPRCCNLGRAGLDYYYQQKMASTWNFPWACRTVNKPVIVHTRSIEEPVSILKKKVQDCGGVLRALQKIKRLQQRADLGMYIYFSGVVTTEMLNRVRGSSLSILLINLNETDSLLAPVPHRGKKINRMSMMCKNIWRS